MQSGQHPLVRPRQLRCNGVAGLCRGPVGERRSIIAQRRNLGPTYEEMGLEDQCSFNSLLHLLQCGDAILGFTITVRACSAVPLELRPLGFVESSPAAPTGETAKVIGQLLRRIG